MITETSAKKIWKILESKYLTKRIENRLHWKRRLYRFQLKKYISIDEHMNNYTKLLTDLANVNVVIEEKDKALILLSYLPNEDYETFVLTLINGKQLLSYNDISSTFVKYELRKDKKSFNSTSAKALTVRGKSSNRKGKSDRDRSKSRADFRDLKKNQCIFCKELGHWNVGCLRIKDKKKSKPEANLL